VGKATRTRAPRRAARGECVQGRQAHARIQYISALADRHAKRGTVDTLREGAVHEQAVSGTCRHSLEGVKGRTVGPPDWGAVERQEKVWEVAVEDQLGACGNAQQRNCGCDLHRM
jgi:hypothetical protein